MINKILWTKNAIADFKISQRINPQVNEKTKEIIGYLTNNKPPYKAFHAERLGSNAKYANC
jgi:Txe/YoeB family toxin of Txe-Axe toxin-antitoxin module